MCAAKGRLLSIDFGKARIGLAISDPLGITAQPLEVVDAKIQRKALLEIKALVDKYRVEKIVIGLPLNMNGSEGPMVGSVREFASKLEESCSVKVIEIDERMTSLQAGKALDSASMRGKKKKKKIDSLSAQIILQTYMDSVQS